ncbi:centrosomal protein [Holotrichia oblita]|uniref:Centrosomal protein n=1 Tax=Holotrichia oblita TaxID=644536 RepID=A0ACB9SU02_HOLOL|nr:centrosomal protein [Holotrichia oblita]
MDWKHIFRLEPENLTEEDKNELLNTIAWHDLDMENLDMQKSLVLLKICQQIMRYKSEQVEALIAELDEIATRQGEEQLRKQEMEYDNRSVKSKRSSSYEMDELEEKYQELKTKFKTQIRNNDKQKKELDKIIENENIALKESLSKTRDKLAEATTQINKFSEEQLANKIKRDEYNETINALEHEKESLKTEIRELGEEKKSYKKQLNEFASEIDSRVDEWKKILDEKNEEIKRLKLLKQDSVKSKCSSINDDNYEPTGQITALNKIISEREDKIHELQKQLEVGAAEMHETTTVLNKLYGERDANLLQISELKQLLKELKKQLKQNNSRCQEQQEQVVFLENLSAKKDKELKEFLDKLKEDGQIELSELIAKLHTIKNQKRYKEKQISDLIKMNNDLQESMLQIERENSEMRSKLGLTDEDVVCITGTLLKEKKQKKLLHELQKNIDKLEEENLSLRLEIQNIGNKTRITEKSNVSQTLKSEVDSSNKTKDKQQSQSIENTINEEAHKAVVDENEALRKGLHEILDSLQTRPDKGLRELKSETLEQLLRALDVKHISGWYHPAMRLQAELHALQGSNMELREQLQIARAQLQSISKSTDQHKETVPVPINQLTEPVINSSSNFDVITNLNTHLMQENEVVTQKNISLSDNLEKYKNSLSDMEQQMVLLYQEYSTEKEDWSKNKETYSKTTSELTEKVDILENKLKEISKYVDKGRDEQAKLKQVSEMSGTIIILNRKALYLENENKKLISELKAVKQDLLDAEIAVKKKINDLKIENNSLSKNIEVLKNNVSNTINLSEHKKLLNDFDNLTLKHRSLLNNVTEICTQNNNEAILMKGSIDLLKNEKEELYSKLKDVISKLNTFEVATYEVDKAIETLSKKLSQIEVNEITERQRANHMTNLYELVKEQLRKSEERYKEFENYNKDLMYRNLSFQECLKEFQDKVINEIDFSDYSAIQSKCGKLLEDNANLAQDIERLQGQLEAVQRLVNTQKLWSSSQEYEFLSLKHQILDLQASTDDKAVISRLSSDVVHARLQEADVQKKIDNILDQYKKLEEEYYEYKNSSETECNKLNDRIKMLTEKNDVLQHIIRQQRQQYFGFVPMSSERRFVDNLIKIYKDKRDSFLSFQKADEHRYESEVIKEQLREQLKLVEELKVTKKNDDKVTKWYNEKSQLQLQELRQRRRSEFVETQLRQALDRINEQDQLMSKLEEELLQACRSSDFSISPDVQSVKLYKNGDNIQETDNVECKVKICKSEETQTLFDASLNPDKSIDEDGMKKLHLELVGAQKQISLKDETIEQLKSKQTELEMNMSMFKSQLGDKQSQITFYEKHIVELQNKKELPAQETKITQDIDITGNEEYIAIKATVTTLQTALAEKEASILKFQSLLKQDRDEHSLAAARMQEELKRLQNVLLTHQQAYKELKESQNETTTNKAAVEQYIKQVHTLENHTAELHTTIASLESQLQTSREECVRWRSLSNDRLQSMEKLRLELETVHRNEVCIYKDECEKWRQEVVSLKTLLIKHTDSTNDKVNNVQKILKERDDRIHELMIQLRQARVDARKKQESADIPKVQELETEVDQVTRELETLRKRHDQLLSREKSARDEIRTLKSQLIKRPTSAARSDKSDNAVKEQLQRKVSTLEKEIDELKENLKEQLIINEQHRIKVNEDFEKWNKQKYWQQTAEKLKVKLKEKTEELEKVQQTCSGYRILIERLEKEKHVLESKNKALRGGSANVNAMKLEVLEIENAKLQAELEGMTVKLEMQQHHSGGLGAAMLQDKLEGQERKIAILELAAKVRFFFRIRDHSLLSSIQTPVFGAKTIPVVFISRGSGVLELNVNEKFFNSNDKANFACTMAKRIPVNRNKCYMCFNKSNIIHKYVILPMHFLGPAPNGR